MPLRIRSSSRGGRTGIVVIVVILTILVAGPLYVVFIRAFVDIPWANPTIDDTALEGPFHPKSFNRTTSDRSAAQEEDKGINTNANGGNGLSVIISTYRQPYCLRQLVQYLRRCKVVTEIRINWFEGNMEMLTKIPNDYFSPPTRRGTNNNSSLLPLPPVYFDILPNRISHRFSPHREQNNNPPLASVATFHVDVDSFYSCRALDFAYDTWRNRYQASNRTVVGYHPRKLRNRQIYSWKESYKPPFRYNTLFVTKGALLHRDLLDLYFQSRYSEWRNRTDEWITGEDMLMSFVLAQNNVETVALCLHFEDSCEVTCEQGNQKSLSHGRSTNNRGKALYQLFQTFAPAKSIFVRKSNSDQMLWLDEWLALKKPRPRGDESNTSTTNVTHHHHNPQQECIPGISDVGSERYAKPTCRRFCAKDPYDNDHAAGAAPVCPHKPPRSPSRDDPVDRWT